MGDAVEACMRVERWMQTFHTPQPDDPDGQMTIHLGAAVMVQLWRSGRLIGTGIDMQPDEGMVRRATARAMGGALAAMREVAGDSAIDTLAGQCTVEIEVATVPRPVTGNTWADVGDRIEPGRHGVAIRRGSGWAWRFPAQLRASNTAGRVPDLMPGMAMELGLGAGELSEHRAGVELTVYRFETIHLVQEPGGVPTLLTRGQSVLPRDVVSRDAVTAMCDGIIAHLTQSAWPGAEQLGIRGTYRPAPDQYDPALAPPLEQALVAEALRRYAAATATVEAAMLADEILVELSRVEDQEADPLENRLACAATIVASLTGGSTAGVAAFLERAERTLVQGMTDRRTDGHGRALIALAYTRMFAAGRAGVTEGMARAALDDAWAAVPEHQHVQLLPWIATAERLYADRTGNSLAHADDLRRVRVALEAGRLSAANRPDAPDLHGGFVLSSKLTADSQTARAAAATTEMLGDDRLVPAAERAEAIDRAGDTIRFLMQLVTTDEMGWSYRRPDRVVGGIRTSMWDRDLAPAAQAMTLIALSEWLEATSDTP